MKIIIASDHAGLDYKKNIINHLNSKGHDVEDFGPYTTDSFDYPDSAHKVALYLKDNTDAIGILLCGTGIGMSIAANRHDHIRAALCSTEFDAKATREHNDANVLCLGVRVTGEGLALSIIDTFLANTFEGGRHIRRLEKINAKL